MSISTNPVGKVWVENMFLWLGPLLLFVYKVRFGLASTCPLEPPSLPSIHPSLPAASRAHLHRLRPTLYCTIPRVLGVVI